MGRAIGPGHAGGNALNTATSAGAALSNLYDRPSSASSSHSQFPRIDGLPGGALANQTMQQHQMMPPPPPRPSTAQSQGHSRPNTALAHHSPTPSMHSSLPLPRPLSRSQQQPIPRPPSRAQQFQAAQQAGQRPPSRAQHHQQMPNTAGAMNGFASKQPHSQVHPQQAQSFPGTSNSNNLQSPVQQQFPGSLSQQSPLGQHFGSQQSQSASHTFAGQGSPSPTATVPGSPLRGAKRKLGVEGSPRLGTGFQGGNAMGPPSALPKTMSEGLTQVGQIAGMGTMSMNNMNQPTNVNGSILLGQSPRPDSASGGVPAGHQTMIDVSMSPGLDTSSRGSDLNMNLSVGLDAMSSGGRGPQTPQSHRPTSSHSRQSSIPPQFPTVTPQNAPPSVPLVQQHMRQGSMPPAVGLLSNVPVKNETRSSVPPAPAVPAASGAAPPAASGAPAAPTSAPAASTKSQGPPLPAGVNPAVTHVTLVPLADSTTNIPDLTDGEIKDIQGWMKNDKEYDTVWRKMKERMEEEEKEIFGPRNLPWWEKGSLAVNANRYRRGRENFDIRYPRKPKENGQRRKGVRREGIKL
jgi:SWI/SNF-related matrix-associated actin-dependent regulator of chromatin subfamily B protein 1